MLRVKRQLLQDARAAKATAVKKQQAAAAAASLLEAGTAVVRSMDGGPGAAGEEQPVGGAQGGSRGEAGRA